MRRHFLGVLERAAIGAVVGDPGGAERRACCPTGLGASYQSAGAPPPSYRGGDWLPHDAAGIAEDRKGWLFRISRGRNGSGLIRQMPIGWRRSKILVRPSTCASGSLTVTHG